MEITSSHFFRKSALAQRQELSDVQRRELSDQAISRLIKHPVFLQTEQLLCYVSYGYELSTEGLIQIALKKNKIVAVPKVTGPGKMEFIQIQSLQELSVGYKGILEPEWCKEKICDKGLLVVPGTAFDVHGHRMGYGGGYYDRWITAHKNQIQCFGLMFECQLFETIPFQSHDAVMDYLVTPEKLTRIGDEYDEY